jgi:hypothetical protein
MSGRSTPTQRDRLLRLLQKRAPAWVALPEILALHIAQYNARVFELRRHGYVIENKQEGEKSWFRLVANPAPTFPQFSDLTPERSYPD